MTSDSCALPRFVSNHPVLSE